MQQNEKEVSLNGIFVLGAVLLNALVLKQNFITNGSYAMLSFTLPLLAASIIMFKRKQQ